MKKLIALLLFVSSVAFGQSYPNPTFYPLSGTTGSQPRTINGKLGESVSLKDFSGCDPTGVTDSTTCLSNFFAAAKVAGRGRLNAGTYKVTSQVNWDLTSVATSGVTIVGDGENNTIINVQSVAASPAFFIGAAGSTALFYSRFSGFAIQGNVAGVVLQLGKPSFTDALNEFQMSLTVNNASANAANVAVQVNYMLNSNVRLVANSSGRGNGDAVQLRQATFNTFSGSWSNALNSVHMTGGFNYGNAILSPDFEVSSFGAVIDEANVLHNTFIGGQWENLTNAINATAGSDNRFISPNFAYASPVASSVGVRVTNTGFGSELFGGTVVSPPTGDGISAVDSIAANSAARFFRNAGVNRWGIIRDTSNNLLFNRYNSGGTFVDSPITIEPTAGAVTAGTLNTTTSTIGTLAVTGTLTPSQTSGIVGTTTNNNANTGSVGEYQTSTTNLTSLVTTTSTNAASVPITAGDWDLECSTQYNPAATTTMAVLQATATTTSAGSAALGSSTVLSAAFTTGNLEMINSPVTRVSLAAPGTAYCVALAIFGVSTMTVSGTIRARRVR